MVPTPAPRGDLISVNFSQADLVEVIHVIAQHLGLNYTIHPDVMGKVTIHSAQPLRREDLLPVFHQILRMNGAVAVRIGDLYRIVPVKEGKGFARPLAEGREDSYALQIVPVRFFSVAEMKKLLTPFLTPGGEILEYPRGNFLIIADLPSNIQRLLEIRDLIDVNVFAGVRMEVYQPKVASAEELATEMTKIMQTFASSAAQAEGFAAQFLPIPRINQILIISHSEAAWTYVKRWLERIDVVAEGPGRRIFIYPVENSKATDLAETLNQVLGITPSVRREVPRTLQDLHRGGPAAPTTPGGPRPPLPPLGSPPAPTTGVQAPPTGAFAAVPTPVEPPRPGIGQISPVPTPGRPDARPEQQLRIVADPATNSLIIFGTAQEFQNIKNILKELDMIPRQVLMEVLVAEVTLLDDLRFGLEYEIQRRTESIGAIGTIPEGSVPLPVGGLFGTFPGTTGLTTVLGKGRDFRVIINSLLTDSRVKVLASPRILATDNRPARIQVGSEEPIPTGVIQTATGATTGIASSTTVQFRNTGRILTIIPQVNSKGLVNLQIKAEVSERGSNVTVGEQSFPSFATRDAETTAVVQDGETLAIGGIISERISRGRIGIPFLMDIPVFGRFFGTTTDSIQRTELVMLITPHVIRNVEEARSVTEEFKEKLSTLARELEREKKALKETPDEPVPEVKPEDKPVEPQSREEKPPVKGGATWHPDLPEEEASPVKIDSPEGIEAMPAPREANTTNGGPKSKGRLWVVQVAAFTDDGSAKTVAERLQEKGYDAYVISARLKGRTWYRVWVGMLETRDQARELQKTLSSKERYSRAFVTVR